MATGAAAVTAATTLPAYLSDPPTAPLPAASPGARYADEVVVVTGGTSGIGEATVRAFAAEGASVVFCCRRAHLGKQIEESLTSAVYVRADVRVASEVEQLLAEVDRRFGRLDIAINNAGVSRTAPAHEMAVDQFDDVLHTNVRGAFLALKYEVPLMLRSGGETRGGADGSAHAGHRRHRGDPAHPRPRPRHQDRGPDHLRRRRSPLPRPARRSLRIPRQGFRSGARARRDPPRGRGGEPFGPDVLRRVVRRATGRVDRAAADLTPRERDVVRLVGIGATNQEIARDLHLGITTVKSYLATAMTKTGARNRVLLAVYAVRHGMV